MGWKLCMNHATLAWLACIMFLMNGVGSAVYLYLEKTKKFEGLDNFRRLSQKVRGTFNTVYFIGGYVLFTIAMIIGVYQSAKIWGSFFPLEPKIFFSIIIWAHYSVTLLTLVIPGVGKTESGSKPLFALLCAIGSVLVIINMFIGNFILPGKHDFF